MDRELLEQLEVPQPPYRMARPTVMLAAEPPPTPEKPIPAPEEPLEIPSELLEPIDEQSEAAIESAAVQEKERIAAAPPLEGATAQELEQDAANRERAALEVDVAVAEETAEARVRVPVKEGKDAEEMTATERQANQELAARLRAERDQQRMEAGIDFPQAKPEALNEKVTRLSQEALQALNDFKEATDRKAKPEEIDFAKQRVNIAQRKLEAAKLGEPIPEERATVTAPASPPAAPAPGPSEPPPAVGDKTPYGEVIAVSPEGKPRIRYEAPVVTPPLSEGELRQKKFAEKSVTEKKKQVTRDQTAALKEEAARADAVEVEVDKLLPADQPVRPNEVGRQQDVPMTGLEEAFDAEGNLNLVPLEERPVAEAAPAPEEGAPTPEAGRIRQLEELNEQLLERVARLEAGLSAPQQSEAGGEQPPGGPPETPEQPPAAGAEGEPEQPERTTIAELGEQQGLSFLEMFKTERAASSEDWKAAVAAILAKKWQGRLERRDEKIRKWEKSGEEASKKGSLGMAKAFIWDEAWANYHRALGRRGYRKQEAWNDARVRRENARNEILNLGAAKIDRLLDSQNERIDQYALKRDEQDRHLETYHAAHKKFTEMDLARATPAQRQAIGDQVDALAARMKYHMEKREELDSKWQTERKRAAKQQARKESLLSYAVRPTRIDTTPKAYKWLTQRITRPGGSPKPRAGSKRIPGLAA